MGTGIFLDRDGVINRERGDYTFQVSDFEIIPGVSEALELFRKKGFKIFVITNQSGISQGLYSHEDVQSCHEYMQEQLHHQIDEIYFSPYHPNITESLSRKPDSLLFEKAIAKYTIDPRASWMIGDRERDLIPAKKLGMSTILVGDSDNSDYMDYRAKDLLESASIILN